MYDKYSIPFVVGFLGAVALFSYIPLPESAAFLAGLLALAFLLLTRSYRLIGVSFLFVGVTVGITRFLFADVPRTLPSEILSGTHVFEGVVTEEPTVTESKATLLVHLENLSLDVLVTTDRYPEHAYGERLSITGTLKKPTNFSDFDWIGYLNFRGVSYIMSYPKLTMLSQGSGSAFFSALLSTKHLFMQKVATALPEPLASFGNGIALGAKSGLPKDLTAEFQRTSTSHLIAVSGYNLTALINSVDFLLARAPLFFARFGGLFAIIAFTLLTGAAGATVRAAIMASALVIARHAGRPVSQFRLLIIAVFFMVLHNPRVLLFDLSFQLSFLATAGIIFLTPLFNEWLARFHFWPLLQETLAGTLAAQTAVLPLILYKTGLLSLVALPVNALVLPLVPLAMGLVVATGLLGIIWYPLGFLFGGFAYGILAYMLFVIHVGSALPFAALSVSFPLAAMLASYGALAIGLWLRKELAKPPQVLVGDMTFEIVDLTNPGVF